MRISIASFCLSVSLIAGLQAQVPPQPLTYSVGIQPDGSVVVPSDQVLTPAGTQIILPLCRANAVTIRPGGHTAAVLAKPANSKPIRIIDLDKGTELQEFAPTSGPTAASYAGILYSADGNTLYASQDSGNILIANVAADGTLTFRSQLSIPQPVKGANPGALALSADGNTLYVVLNTYNTLGVFDLASGTLVNQIPVENAPRDIVIVGGFAYVSNEGGRVATAGDFTMNGRDNAAILLGAPNMTSYGGPAGTLKSTDIYTPIVADPVTGAATTGSVSVVDLKAGRTVQNIPVGLHPTALAAANNLVFVTNSNSDSISVIDVNSRQVLLTQPVQPFANAPFGSSPNGLAIAGNQLFVSYGANNAIGVHQLSFSPLSLTVQGMIPTGWYPDSIAIDQAHNQLVVANVKGIGTLGPTSSSYGVTGHTVTAQTGTVSLIPIPTPDQLKAYSSVVLANNHAVPVSTPIAPSPAASARAIPLVIGEPSPIKHVFLIVKENRTYDQVLGDDLRGNGSPSLAIFGQNVTPNQHALSKRFPLFDNFYSSGIQSADGHQWVVQAMAPDYVERNGTDVARSYPYNGGDPLAAGGGGYIWDNAVQHGLSVRVYGEYADIVSTAPNVPYGSWTDYYNDSQILEGKRSGTLSQPVGIRQQATQIPRLNALLNHNFPGFDGGVPDQYRADIFLTEFAQYVRGNNLPQLVIIQLSADHTTGTGPGLPTPTATVADNDLAVGRIVDAISHSRFWSQSAIFIEEDDSQNGVDHVDGHRQAGLVISPYARQDGLVDSTFYTQINMDRTIEQILGLPPMNQFDLAAAPMFTAFTDTPNLAPYTTLAATYPVDEMNPAPAAMNKIQREWSLASQKMMAGNEHDPDQQDERMMNHLVWYSATGWKRPYPGETSIQRPGKLQKILNARAVKPDVD